MSHPLPQIIKRFFSHYLPSERGLSPNTILSYRDTLKQLLCSVADDLGKSVDGLVLEDINETRVLNFLDHVEQERGCCPETRNSRLTAIRRLFFFISRQEPDLLVQCHIIRSISLKRTGHRPFDYLEEKQMQSVFGTIDLTSRTGIRDRAMLLLLYNTGARVSEIVALKLSDLRLDDSPQVTLMGKGRKERSCPLWPETVAVLMAYLNQRKPKDPTAQQLFLNANNVPITRFGIRYITRKYGSLVKQLRENNKALNPHCVRHTTAMHLLRAGNDINMVSYWLGHAHLNTTHAYVEIDMEKKREMLAKADAPSVKKAPPWRKPDLLDWLTALGKNPELCGVQAKKSGKKKA
jgi:site-specific recombinase XerD